MKVEAMERRGTVWLIKLADGARIHMKAQDNETLADAAVRFEDCILQLQRGGIMMAEACQELGGLVEGPRADSPGKNAPGRLW